MSQIRKTAALVAATAVLGGGGIGVAQAASANSSGSDGPRAGHHGGGPASSTQLAAIAKQLGVSSAELKAAIDAGRPAKPADGARGDGMATALATALGVDADKVREILDANRPARPARLQGSPPAGAGMRTAGRPDGRPQHDNTRLVAALASGLNIDTATVKAALAKIDAAHKADHGKREAAMYASIAKELGLTRGAVRAAFDANRPAMPARPMR